MLGREHGLTEDGRVVVDGVALSRDEIVYLLGFVSGAERQLYIQIQRGQQQAPVNCPLTDEEYQLLDDDGDDDDEPEFPTAYEGEGPEGSPQ
jgi:hypothetical protein